MKQIDRPIEIFLNGARLEQSAETDVKAEAQLTGRLNRAGVGLSIPLSFVLHNSSPEIFRSESIHLGLLLPSELARIENVRPIQLPNGMLMALIKDLPPILPDAWEAVSLRAELADDRRGTDAPTQHKITLRYFSALGPTDYEIRMRITYPQASLGPRT